MIAMVNLRLQTNLHSARLFRPNFPDRWCASSHDKSRDHDNGNQQQSNLQKADHHR